MKTILFSLLTLILLESVWMFTEEENYCIAELIPASTPVCTDLFRNISEGAITIVYQLNMDRAKMLSFLKQVPTQLMVKFLIYVSDHLFEAALNDEVPFTVDHRDLLIEVFSSTLKFTIQTFDFVIQQGLEYSYAETSLYNFIQLWESYKQNETSTKALAMQIQGLPTFPQAVSAKHVMKYIKKYKSSGEALVVAYLVDKLKNYIPETAFGQIKESTPLSVRNMVFARTMQICLDRQENAYLMGGDENKIIRKYRREVTVGTEGNNTLAEWKLELVDQETKLYYIKNVHHGEYLYTSVLDYSQDRWRVFTWTNKNLPPSDRARFYLEPMDDGVLIHSHRPKESLFADKVYNSSEFVVSVMRDYSKLYRKWNRTEKLPVFDKWVIEEF